MKPTPLSPSILLDRTAQICSAGMICSKLKFDSALKQAAWHAADNQRSCVTLSCLYRQGMGTSPQVTS